MLSDYQILLRAREAAARKAEKSGYPKNAAEYRAGIHDSNSTVLVAIETIKVAIEEGVIDPQERMATELVEEALAAVADSKSKPVDPTVKADLVASLTRNLRMQYAKAVAVIGSSYTEHEWELKLDALDEEAKADSQKEEE